MHCLSTPRVFTKCVWWAADVQPLRVLVEIGVWIVKRQVAGASSYPSLILAETITSVRHDQRAATVNITISHNSGDLDSAPSSDESDFELIHCRTLKYDE
ncbi:hypothetical protein TNCV_1676321 [Trichonephila clavipes]|nr:hypothetical protein TNCV_1676321 [Trichonephila clavipes]